MIYVCIGWNGKVDEDMKTEMLWRALPRKIREKLTEKELEKMREIRLRCGRPAFAQGKDGQIQKLTEEITAADLRETVSLLSAYSLYAFEEELKQGYLTVAGGHRVGFCGKTVMENGEIRTLKQINGLNIRIAAEKRGWGDAYLSDLMEEGHVCNTLIVSPPGCGKTTLLRDLVRCLGDSMMAVTVVDERGEIAPFREGVPQMNIGLCTDVLEGCPKAAGMQMVLRSMTPDVIAVDELGSPEDMQAVQDVLLCGVKLIATAHGNDWNEIYRRPYLGNLVAQEVFERYIILSSRNGVGTMEAVLDRQGKMIRKGALE